MKNMSKLFRTMMILALGVSAGACGSDDSTDNVASCKDYVAALDCGSLDISTVYPANFCDAYANTSCDISDYFDCLTSNTMCVLNDPILGDHLDQSGTTMCASMANCN